MQAHYGIYSDAKPGKAMLDGLFHMPVAFRHDFERDYERNFPGSCLAEPIPSANVRLRMPLKYRDFRFSVRF